MVFEHMGFSIHCIGINRFFVWGPGFCGYATSENEARQIINIITAGHCVEE